MRERVRTRRCNDENGRRNWKLKCRFVVWCFFCAEFSFFVFAAKQQGIGLYFNVFIVLGVRYFIFEMRATAGK